MQELEKIAQQQKLYFLISTDTPQKAWQLTPSLQQQYWINLDDKNINYDPALIVQELVNAINKEIGNISFSNGLRSVTTSSDLPGGSISQLAKNFSTPEQVHFFVRQLSTQKGTVDLTIIQDCLKHSLNKQDTLLHKWFHALNPLEQYIGLSMVLFSDLFDDQYFGVAKILAESAWQYSHDGLKALDYKDIEKLFNFFKYDTVNREQRYIRNKYPNQRIELIQSSWYSHRRHIKMAVEVGVSLAIEASKNSHRNSELYGSRQKRNTLRMMVSNLLSDLGRVSRSLIEEPLLILASQDALELQNIAAGAIANWREIPGGDKQLFEVLNDWQKSSQFTLAMSELIKGRENAATPVAYMRSAIILTIGKAANYDTPNHLSKELIELLFSFLHDTHRLVRSRFIQIIPDIIRHHALQFSGSMQVNGEKIVPLERLLKDNDLIYPVAIGLALAFLDDEHRISKVISSCIKYCEGNASASNPRELNDRDKLQAAMILAIGKIIELEDEHELISGKTAYQLLYSIREKENNHVLKNLLLLNIIDQIGISNNKRDLIDILLPKLSADERDQLVYGFGQWYLEQRKELEGGERSIKINNVDYDIWIHKTRPFVEIEKLMFDWLKDDNVQLQQLATLTFIEFSYVLEHEEEKARQQVIDNENRAAIVTQSNGKPEPFKSALVKSRFSLINGVHKTLINTTISKEAAKIVNAAHPVISSMDGLNKEDYKRLVLEKWKKMQGNIKEAAESLAKLK